MLVTASDMELRINQQSHHLELRLLQSSRHYSVTRAENSVGCARRYRWSSRATRGSVLRKGRLPEGREYARAPKTVWSGSTELVRHETRDTRRPGRLLDRISKEAGRHASRHRAGGRKGQGLTINERSPTRGSGRRASCHT